MEISWDIALSRLGSASNSIGKKTTINSPSVIAPISRRRPRRFNSNSVAESSVDLGDAMDGIQEMMGKFPSAVQNLVGLNGLHHVGNREKRPKHQNSIILARLLPRTVKRTHDCGVNPNPVAGDVGTQFCGQQVCRCAALAGEPGNMPMVGSIANDVDNRVNILVFEHAEHGMGILMKPHCSQCICKRTG